VFDLERTKYIYYPIQYQPEASTVPASVVNFNQLSIILSISKVLPKNIKLVIKENPRYWSNTTDLISLSRSIKFYKSILSKDNVILVDQRKSSLELINYSDSVSLITGTVALEALRNGKY